MNPYYNNGYNAYPTGGYNPVNRLNALEQQINQQQMQTQTQPQPMQMQQPQFPSVRPVTSIEEVRGITPNFDGSKMWFEDATNKKLYSKYIDLNGVPHMDVYALSNEDKKQEMAYCTKEEYNILKSELDNYKSVLDNLLSNLGGTKNEQ